jgi:hypothetical protein
MTCRPPAPVADHPEQHRAARRREPPPRRDRPGPARPPAELRAALHHLQVALAALDLPVRVHRLPDPEDLGHLPTIEILPSSTDPTDTDSAYRADAAMADSIDRRRTERRRMSHRPVPARHLAALGEQAARLGARLVPVTDPTLRQRARSRPHRGRPRPERHPGLRSRSKPIGTGAKAIGWQPAASHYVACTSSGVVRGDQTPAGRPLIQAP